MPVGYQHYHIISVGRLEFGYINTRQNEIMYFLAESFVGTGTEVVSSGKCARDMVLKCL